MPAKAINLLPHKDFEHTFIGKFLRWSLTYGRYIIICTEVIVLMSFIYRFSLDRKITDLNEAIDQKSAIVTANQGFEASFRNLQTRTSNISNLFTNQDLVITILEHLQKITPTSVVFTSLAFSSDRISISATAQSTQALSAFIQNLQGSTLLTDVSVTNVNKSSQSSGQISFDIETGIKIAPKPTGETTP